MTQKCLACNKHAIWFGYCLSHAKPKKQLDNRHNNATFEQVLMELYEKRKHKCRYCEATIYKNDVCFYDPQFDELVHASCLEAIREGHFSVMSVVQLTTDITKEPINEHYVVWHVADRMK